MSSYHYTAPYPNSMPHSAHPQQHHNHHHGRRRGPRISSAQNAHRQQFVKAQKGPKEVQENPAAVAYAKDFEAARGFEIEDDEVFCPFHLLTDDDLQSVHSSSSSDRSSLSSGSPTGSPLQHQVQPTPSFVLSTPSNFNHSSFHHNAAATAHQQRMKLHQPMAQRSRNAIPIVDPHTRSNIASPPPSVSPARQMQQQFGRRW